MPTLLHISDLHRTADPHLSNDEILSAIESDSRRWQAEGIPSPDAIVVSGDLVQGANIGDVEADTKIKAQYAEAGEFLRNLADRFVESNLSRVIIVPGNHDVNWRRARAAMEEMEICPPGIVLVADSKLILKFGGTGEISERTRLLTITCMTRASKASGSFGRISMRE